MGAHSFTVTSNITDPAAAYTALVDEALHEYGHGPYNGTISTTSGFSVVSYVPVSATAAQDLITERIGQLNKRGPCEAIPVGETATTRSRTATLRITCPAERGQALQVHRGDVAAALGVPPASVESFEILESAARYTTTKRKAGPARKVWTTSAGGRFDTRAAAIDHATRIATTDQNDPRPTVILPYREVLVFPLTVHEPEAAVICELRSWKIRVRAVVSVPGPLTFRHWLFYGWAAE
jgi:hypothetical protein